MPRLINSTLKSLPLSCRSPLTLIYGFYGHGVKQKSIPAPIPVDSKPLSPQPSINIIVSYTPPPHPTSSTLPAVHPISFAIVVCVLSCIISLRHASYLRSTDKELWLVKIEWRKQISKQLRPMRCSY